MVSNIALSPVRGYVNRLIYQRFDVLNRPPHTSYPAVSFRSSGFDTGAFARSLCEIAQSGARLLKTM
jgi:hypothetical protein